MSSAGLKEWDLRGMGDTLFKQSSSSDQAHKEKRTDIQCTNGQYLWPIKISCTVLDVQ